MAVYSIIAMIQSCISFIGIELQLYYLSYALPFHGILLFLLSQYVG